MPAAKTAVTDCAMVRHKVLKIETSRAIEFVDVTDRLAAAVHDSGVVDGVMVVQSRHTTTGLLVNEHEPLLLGDLAAMFQRVAPQAIAYAHDDFVRRGLAPSKPERINGPAHCRAALLRTSEYVPISGGSLTLGRWQRIFFVDFDGGQHRELWVTLLGDTAPPALPAGLNRLH